MSLGRRGKKKSQFFAFGSEFGEASDIGQTRQTDARDDRAETTRLRQLFDSHSFVKSNQLRADCWIRGCHEP